MAAYTEVHDGTTYVRLYALTLDGSVGTCHLAERYGYRDGVTLCGAMVQWSGREGLKPLLANAVEVPNRCKNCERVLEARLRR